MNYSTSATTKVVNYKDIDRVRGVHRYVFLNALINIYYSIDVIDNDKLEVWAIASHGKCKSRSQL